MIVHGFDAGGKIDKGAFVTLRVKGDFKAPVPQNIEMELVEAKPFETRTLPKGYSDFVGYYVSDDTFKHEGEEKK